MKSRLQGFTESVKPITREEAAALDAELAAAREGPELTDASMEQTPPATEPGLHWSWLLQVAANTPSGFSEEGEDSLINEPVSQVEAGKPQAKGSRKWNLGWVLAIAASLLLIGTISVQQYMVSAVTENDDVALLDFDFDLHGEAATRDPGPLILTAGHIFREKQLSPPKDLDSWRKLGQLYLRQKRYGEALQAFQHILAERPADFGSQLGAGIAEFARARETDDFKKALAHFKKAVAVRPKSSAAVLNVAICQQRMLTQDLDQKLRRQMAVETIESWKQVRSMTSDDLQRAEIDELIEELKSIAEE